MKVTHTMAVLLAVLIGISVYGLVDANSDAHAIKRFHQLFYNSHDTCRRNTWLGIGAEQNPLDVWITQEIMFETKPDLVVECGAEFGGSAILWAHILQAINPAGQVVSIDIVDKMQEARKHPIAQARVKFLVGSSTSSKIVAEVGKLAAGKKVLVILDSDHRKAHVLDELRLYSPLVGVGGYICVQDTDVNGHPVASAHGPGPMEAVEEFLASDGRFAVDPSRERLMLTFHPKGYLKRVK